MKLAKHWQTGLDKCSEAVSFDCKPLSEVVWIMEKCYSDKT